MRYTLCYSDHGFKVTDDYVNTSGLVGVLPYFSIELFDKSC